ncbi:DUF6492 family protein [Ruegeria arenilitoris]|uniref:DUF6492 family protein n=1 Tax=Ruegeria arenilitoris TaxID=1173585 RepID=UPI00147D0A26|nr:DUF6492 family protein [Ruegeria arenilitoris]
MKGAPTVLSFATIVYSKDYPLLELQARSFARFADPAKVASIHVVLNDVDETTLRTRIEPILAAYGPLQSKVRVVGGDEILLGAGQCTRRSLGDRLLIEGRHRIPFVRKGGWRGNNGYRAQQVLKLGAARIAEAEQMVILDTKNLFLRSFTESEFFSDGGAARLPFISVNSEFHRNWLQQSLDALQVTVPDIEALKTTTFSTPFPVRRSLVLEMLDEINERYGSVQSLFGSRRRPSEFMLLNAFCLRSDLALRPWFEDASSTALGLWPTYSQKKLEDLIAGIDEPELLSLGLHNRAVSMLTPETQDRLFDALARRGISDRETTQSVLNATASLAG